MRTVGHERFLRTGIHGAEQPVPIPHVLQLQRQYAPPLGYAPAGQLPGRSTQYLLKTGQQGCERTRTWL